MPLNFPDSPSVNQEYSANGKSWRWNGSKWVAVTRALVNTNLDDIGNVNAGIPSSGDFLKWNGTAWVNDPINLGTDTVGNYVNDVTAGTGVTVTHTPGEGSSPTVAIGQAVDASASVTFGQLETTGNVTVGGNLTVNGSTTVFNTETLAVEDNSITLNSNVTGSPTTNAGIEIERGTSTNVELRWNETYDKWEITNDGSAYKEIAGLGSIALGTDTTGNYVSDVVSGTGVTITHTPGEGSSASIAIGQDVGTSASVTFAKVTAPVTGDLTGNASTASTLQTSRTISISGDVSGSVSFDGSTNVDISAVIQSNSVALGVDTTGNYVSDITAGTGVTVTHTPGEGTSPTVAIGQAVGTSASVQFAQVETTGDLTVGGNLTVNGTTTTLNTESLAVEDNIVVLNSNVSGAPVANAGIEVERGSSNNVSIRWNETSDKWEITNDGSNYSDIATESFTTAITYALDDLSDVDASSPSDGQFLKYVSASAAWTPAAIPTINNLDDIGDVSASAPSSGDFLKWNGTAWVNDAIDLATDTTGNYVSDVVSGTGITVSHTAGEGSTASVALNATLDDLSNVNASSPSDGQFLKYVSASTAWVPAAIPTINNLDDVGDVSASAPSTGDFLKWNGTAWINDPIDLSTDTTGNYVSDVTAGTGVTVTHTPSEGSSPTIAIGQAVETSSSVTFARVETTGNLVVGGDLTVNGTTTTLNTETLAVEDNIITLNSNVSASPTTNAGIEVERGTSTNVVLRWNETTDTWQFTNDGTNYTDLGAGGATISSTAPGAPTAGALWFDSDTAQTFVYYDSSWIEIGGASGGARMQVSSGAPSSPLEGIMWFDSDTAQTFIYYDEQWIEIGASAMAAVVSTTAPDGPIAGQIWFNSDTGATYVYYSDVWIEVGAAAVNTVLQAINAKGDLVVGAADNTVDNLPVGIDGYRVTAASGEATGLKYDIRSIPVYADTVARDASYGGAGEATLSQGMCCYITNINQLQIYDGSEWKQVVTGATKFLDDVQIDTAGLSLNGFDTTVDGGKYGFISRVNSTDANGSYLGFFKARGTAGSQTVVSDGDDIGLIRFFGYDGSTFREAARIRGEVDGTPGASDMPGSLTFYTTADDGTTLSERMKIDNAGLITGTGTSLGAWTAFTPTWTNLTIGNGTQDWVYCQLGKFVFVRGRMTWGSTTSSTGGATVMSLPVNFKSTLFRGLGAAVFVDSGTQTYWGEIYPDNTNRVGFNTKLVSGSYQVSSAVTNSTPFTWTTGDSIQCQFYYEGA